MSNASRHVIICNQGAASWVLYEVLEGLNHFALSHQDWVFHHPDFERVIHNDDRRYDAGIFHGAVGGDDPTFRSVAGPVVTLFGYKARSGDLIIDCDNEAIGRMAAKY